MILVSALRVHDAVWRAPMTPKTGHQYVCYGKSVHGVGLGSFLCLETTVVALSALRDNFVAMAAAGCGESGPRAVKIERS
jgi:hypothetical protein